MINQIYWFGIGFNRSGTLSLTEYFRQWGLSTAHWVNGTISKQIEKNHQQGIKLLTGLEQWNAFFDMEHFDSTQPLGYYKSYQLHFKELEQQYPNSIFIFNKRPCREWIKSLFHHKINKKNTITLEYMKDVSGLSVYQIVQKLEDEYYFHYYNVLNYFKDKPDKLLIFDLENLEQSIFNLEIVLKRFYGEKITAFPNINQGKRKKISLMICCMSRTNHLSQTLEKNIKDNLDDQNDVEFVIVHFLNRSNKQQDLEFQHLINEKFSLYLENGYLKYFQNSDFHYWKAGGCRYTAFWYTRADLVYNLDCDNFIGLRGTRAIVENFNKYGNHNLIFLGFNGVYADGSFGRICLSEKNHFLINSYDYNLPTIWSHDDSLLLLKSLIYLKLKLLLPNRDSINYLQRLLIGTGYSSQDSLQLVNKIEIIVDPFIIPHSGISHHRIESFKTVNYTEQILNNDLQTGYLYLKNQIPNITQIFEQISSTQNQNLNQIKSSNVFYNLEDYLEKRKHYKIVYYLEYNYNNNWENIEKILESTNEKITIVTDSKLYQQIINTNSNLNYSNLNYSNLIWLLEPNGFENIDKISYPIILIRLDNRIRIVNQNLSNKIVKLLNQYQCNLIVSNSLISVKKIDYNWNSEKCVKIDYDFLKDRDICFQLPIKYFSNWNLVVWGNPTDYDKLNIGESEKNRRDIIVKNSQTFIDYCQTFGLNIIKINDKQNIQLTLGYNTNTIILTYGLFCYNKKIPILSNVKYLIWQPDQSFNISYFPFNQTLVVAYYKKTDYDTFLLQSDNQINYEYLLACFQN